MALPVSVLNYSVTNIFSKLPSLKIEEVIKKGLKPQILYQDYVDGEECLAEIHDDGQVYLSLSFAQSIWNLCSVILKLVDYKIIEDEFLRNGIEIDQVYVELTDSGCTDYRIKYLVSLIDAPDWEEMYLFFETFLNKTQTDTDIAKLNSFDLYSPFFVKVSGMYSYALAFVLLHELFHLDKGHFEESCMLPDTDQEWQADDCAFDSFMKDLNGNDLKSSFYGTMAVLLSFFYLNPELNNNDIHPREDKRLFRQYHKIPFGETKEKIDKVVQLFLTKWASYTGFAKYSPLLNQSITVSEIEKYLNSI